MKKQLTAVLLAMALMFSAGNALAGDVDMDGNDNIGIGIDNVNTINNTADANAVAEQQQTQAQTLNFNNVRGHITALPGSAGNFITAPMALVGNWTPFLGSPLFASFSAERIHQMSASDSFWGGVKIKKVVHVSRNGNGNSQSVSLIGWDVREGAYASDQLLGEFQCQGEYGMPMGASLGRCLEEAQKTTGTVRVFAAYKLRRDPKNSGFSIGSGAAGAKMLGSSGSVDEVAGAMSLGGLIGTTRASVDEAYDWTVLALNDGPLTRTVEPTACKTPPATPKTCDPSALLLRINTLKEGTVNCPNECLNNELLWKQIGDANMDLFYCTGNRAYLDDAIYAYGRSERNFLEGREPSGKKTRSLKGAQEILYRTHYNWALAIRERDGRDAEISFAKSKGLQSKGDRTMPEVQADIKR